VTKKPTFTIPSDESDAGRIAVYLDPDDIQWLSARCECNDKTTDDNRERCARIRFRSSTALHKTKQTIDAPADCHFVANIRMLTEESGGRKSAIHTGYRPQVFLDGDDCDATLTIDGETLNPGDVGIVFGVLMNPDRNSGKLSVGKALLLREGARTVAYGVIVWHIDQRTMP
jgi:Elongation factor Tu C-terminal domain